VLFDRCRADTACATAYPRLGEEFAGIVASLARAPVTTSLVDRLSGAYVTIDVNVFMNVVLSGYLAWTPAAATLPMDIHAAATGDWTGFTAKLESTTAGDDAVSVMAVTVRCSDEWASYEPARTAAAAPGSPFTDYEVQLLSGFSSVCAYWPRAAGASGRVKSTAPIVFLNSTGDPVDPPRNVASAKADMPNSLVVAIQGAGHWQLEGDRSQCLDVTSQQFLESGKPSSLDRWTCPPSLPGFAIG